MLKTVKDVKKFVVENDIRMIDFRMIDINGRWHHLTIPAERFSEDTMISGIGFDGSNYGFAPVEKSDMVFIPDLSSAQIDPFCEIATLAMIGDVRVIGKDDNTPFNQEPRNVSKRAEEYMKETGVADTFLLGPEFEFYVFDEVSYENRPQSTAKRLSGIRAIMLTAATDIRLLIRADIMQRLRRISDTTTDPELPWRWRSRAFRSATTITRSAVPVRWRSRSSSIP